MKPITVIKFLSLRLAIIVIVLGVLEFAFRNGIWEPLAKPDSYSGKVVQIKNSVEALGPDKVDFITVGDSRVGSGIDHERIAALAKKYGFQHVDVASPGMHWMSIDLMIRWVKSQSPRLKNAVIASNITSFQYSTNGMYELGLAAPVARPWNSEWMSKSIEPNLADIRTYGVYSALFQYRDDIQDLIKNPKNRLWELNWTRKNGLGEKLIFHNYPTAKHVCRIPLSSLATCAAFKPTNPEDVNVVGQCQNNLSKKPRPDWTDFAVADAHPHLAPLTKMRQQEIRDLPLQHPIIMLLMPVPKLTREATTPKGLEEYTHSVLDPLEREGVIKLYDYTRLLDGENGIDCTAFHDLIHENSTGQKILTDLLLPHIEEVFYRAAAPSAAKP